MTIFEKWLKLKIDLSLHTLDHIKAQNETVPETNYAKASKHWKPKKIIENIAPKHILSIFKNVSISIM